MRASGLGRGPDLVEHVRGSSLQPQVHLCVLVRVRLGLGLGLGGVVRVQYQKAEPVVGEAAAQRLGDPLAHRPCSADAVTGRVREPLESLCRCVYDKLSASYLRPSSTSTSSSTDIIAEFT